ncbi:MAG: intradiol ring-cleavage dioxygenase [Acidimicrobiales bacterium]
MTHEHIPTAHDAHDAHDDFGGIDRDLPRLLPRRTLLGLLGAAGAAAFATRLAGGTATALAAGSCTVIPEETAGPYPGDGSNGVNVLTRSGIVRSDIRSSFGASTTTAPGVPTTITLTVSDLMSGCAPVQGLAVYLWHCNRDGAYSLYSSGITNENYLRGVQETDANGQVTFTTVFPGCYAGRWPHVHFEVYPSLASATTSANKIATSQLAIPKAMCDTIYATTAYASSRTNLAGITLATDNVFSNDLAVNQLATATGDANGVTLSLALSVDAQGNGTTSGGSTTTTGDTTVTPTTSPTTIGAPSAFSALSTPVRVLDTRSGTKPAAGETVTMAVLGQAGVPSSGVSAVVMNVTATEATAAGYVTVWPDGSRPTASNLNLESAGQTRANLVTVPVGADGSVRLFTQSGTHLVADLFGWYAPASASSAGRFVSLTPGRLLDTRSATQVGYTGSKPAAGATVTVAVLGQQGVPSSGVSAVALNVTATEATTAGYVTVWPDGSRPSTSNLNVESSSQTIANQVIVPVGADGSVRLFTQSGTHLVVDVAGWYTDSSASSGTSGLFVPVSPYRVLDTRSGGVPAAGTTITLLAAATGTAAAGRHGLAMNVTATEATKAGYVTVWPDGTRPTASNLNLSAAGQTVANHAICATGSDGGVRLFTQNGTHLVVDVNGWFV